MKWIAAALLLVALSGCVSPGNLRDPAKLNVADVTTNKGLLVLSAGADKSCESYTYKTSLWIERAGKSYPSGNAIMLLTHAVGQTNDNSAVIEVDGTRLASDFEDHYGTLNAIGLEPGEYQVYQTTYLGNSAVNVPRAYVTVVAGKTFYLGEAYLARACGPQTQMVFRDQSERDLKLLQKKNPALAAVPVEKKILAFSDYIVGGKSTKP